MSRKRNTNARNARNAQRNANDVQRDDAINAHVVTQRDTSNDTHDVVTTTTNDAQTIASLNATNDTTTNAVEMFNETMTMHDRNARVDELIAQLRASNDRKRDKRIRAMLRRLNHRGGLRSIDNATNATNAIA